MSVLQSSLLYYFIIIFTTTLVLISEKIRRTEVTHLHRLIFWSALILPVLISGLRYGIGTDYFSYGNTYFMLNNYDIIDGILNTRYEPGWIVLNHVVKFIFDDVRFLFIISALLTWFFFFKAIYTHRDKINVTVAILILLCTLYNLSFNNVRQPLAISILMLSIKPLLDRKMIKFLLITIFATCFHYTALIFLPSYWIVNSKFKQINFVKKTIVIISSLIFIIMFKPFMDFLTNNIDMFSSYSTYELDFKGIGFGNLIIKSPIIIIILLNITKMRTSNNIMYRVFFLYFMGLIFDYLGYYAAFVGRISLYFEATQIFILPAIIKIQNNKYARLLYIFIVALYFIGLFTYDIIILNHNQTIPYIWNFN
ncbi:EpsG family protein [Lentibacillus salicampi]|uniref:EpsG family protein n=1 Tax=Lentibacillus salicampi TaxID=175306 RepID=A0A4Y9AB81_9BACI|nr:EpsG family protein [Lentibacillus salicampi]TFJ93046.1 EpsG family protein [Lentibacillus salicampi]